MRTLLHTLLHTQEAEHEAAVSTHELALQAKDHELRHLQSLLQETQAAVRRATLVRDSLLHQKFVTPKICYTKNICYI